jgi:hypothetical protein
LLLCALISTQSSEHCPASLIAVVSAAHLAGACRGGTDIQLAGTASSHCQPAFARIVGCE